MEAPQPIGSRRLFRRRLRASCAALVAVLVVLVVDQSTALPSSDMVVVTPNGREQVCPHTTQTTDIVVDPGATPAAERNTFVSGRTDDGFDS